MNQNNSGPIRPYNPGFFGGISNQVKLVLRLMADGRVNLLLKLIPTLSGVYLLYPDLLPGPVDDMLLVWLSTYLFVELCPPEVVSEHEQRIGIVSGRSDPSKPAKDTIKDEDIIEGEIVEKSPPPQP